MQLSLKNKKLWYLFAHLIANLFVFYLYFSINWLSWHQYTLSRGISEDLALQEYGKLPYDFKFLVSCLIFMIWGLLAVGQIALPDFIKKHKPKNIPKPPHIKVKLHRSKPPMKSWKEETKYLILGMRLPKERLGSWCLASLKALTFIYFLLGVFSNLLSKQGSSFEKFIYLREMSFYLVFQSCLFIALVHLIRTVKAPGLVTNSD